MTVNRANRLVGLIKCALSYLDEEILLILYKTLIRPILDYGNTIWFPIRKKDIRSIENVQRRVTKHLAELSQLSYKESLQSLYLTTFLYRRNQPNEMIQVFKIVQNIDDIPMQELFEFSDTLHSSKKLKKPGAVAVNSFKFNSFCVRSINNWNNLPDDMVSSNTVLKFKPLYDIYMADQIEDMY